MLCRVMCTMRQLMRMLVSKKWHAGLDRLDSLMHSSENTSWFRTNQGPNCK